MLFLTHFAHFLPVSATKYMADTGLWQTHVHGRCDRHRYVQTQVRGRHMDVADTGIVICGRHRYVTDTWMWQAQLCGNTGVWQMQVRGRHMYVADTSKWQTPVYGRGVEEVCSNILTFTCPVFTT